MPTKTYSSSGCDCYYTDQSYAWVLCEKHAIKKDAPVHDPGDEILRNEKLIKQKLQNNYISRKYKSEDIRAFGHHNQTQEKRPTALPEKGEHARLRAIKPTGKYGLEHIRTHRKLSPPDPDPDPSTSHSKTNSFWLYALRLEKNKYYVGITAKSNPLSRIDNHGTPFGARWTLKYTPIEILEIIDLGRVSKDQAEKWENDVTLLYMKKHGRRNVRGGYMATPGWLYFTAKNPTNRRPLTIDSLYTAIVNILFIGFWVAVAALGVWVIFIGA